MPLQSFCCFNSNYRSTFAPKNKSLPLPLDMYNVVFWALSLAFNNWAISPPLTFMQDFPLVLV